MGFCHLESKWVFDSNTDQKAIFILVPDNINHYGFIISKLDNGSIFLIFQYGFSYLLYFPI